MSRQPDTVTVSPGHNGLVRHRETGERPAFRVAGTISDITASLADARDLPAPPRPWGSVGNDAAWEGS